MNDYYKVSFNLSPANADAADYLASELGDIGYESFETSDTGDAMTAYVPASLYDERTTAAAVVGNPFDVTIHFSAEFVPGQDWNQEWERHYFRPIIIGGRVVVHSSFHQDVPQADIDITIDPRMAFGTGHHATTTLMMEFILGHDMQGCSVLDMGTGTAILAILAAKCGACRVVGIEIDPSAAENAVDNVALNLDTTSSVDIITGDAGSIPKDLCFDYVLANINRNIICGDIAQYASALKPGGMMCLSGFYVADRPIVLAAGEACGMRCADMKDHDDWSSIWLVKQY